MVSSGITGKPTATTTNYVGTFGSHNPSSIIFQLNRWEHLTVTYNNTVMKVYINGVIGVSNKVYLPANVLRTSNFIGKSHWGDVNANCEFDDLKIFNKSLTQLEIYKVMNIDY